MGHDISHEDLKKSSDEPTKPPAAEDEDPPSTTSGQPEEASNDDSTQPLASDGAQTSTFERTIITSTPSDTTAVNIPIAIDDIINDMQSSPTTTDMQSSQGYFPDNFENGFDQLKWLVQHWEITETGDLAPFHGKYSAMVNGHDLNADKRAKLGLEINSGNGGRICFYLWADIGMKKSHDSFRF